MNAFCVKAALSVVGRAPGRLRAGLKGGREGAEEGPASGKSVSAAFDLVSSRVHRRWIITLLQKQSQVRFEIPAEIPVGH